MGERFLLNRVDSYGRELAVSETHKTSILVLLDVAEPAFPNFDNTLMGTDGTPDGVFIKGLIEP